MSEQTQSVMEDGYNQCATLVLEAMDKAAKTGIVSRVDMTRVLIDLAAVSAHVAAGEPGLRDAIARFEMWIGLARSGKLPGYPNFFQ